MTYGVDAMRQVILREGQFPIDLDLCIMIAFAAIMLVFTSHRFTIKKMKRVNMQRSWGGVRRSGTG